MTSQYTHDELSQVIWKRLKIRVLPSIKSILTASIYKNMEYGINNADLSYLAMEEDDVTSKSLDFLLCVESSNDFSGDGLAVNK